MHFCLADGALHRWGSRRHHLRQAQRYRPLARLQLKLHGEVLPVPVLNEVLVHDLSPAGTLPLHHHRWPHHRGTSARPVSMSRPASGSTAVDRSAGGKILPITQRQFQYLVREPGMRPGEAWKLLGGALSPHAELKFTSQMGEGRLYVDGKYGYVHDFLRGDELVVSVHPQDVRAYIDPTVNSRYKVIQVTTTKVIPPDCRIRQSDFKS